MYEPRRMCYKYPRSLVFSPIEARIMLIRYTRSSFRYAPCVGFEVLASQVSAAQRMSEDASIQALGLSFGS